MGTFVCLGLAVNFLISPIAAGFGSGQFHRPICQCDDARINGHVGSGRSQIIRENERRSKMSFKLSQRSLGKLEGVHPKLQEVVKLAIGYTNVDFGVTYGVRDPEEQARLVAAGRSQTMKSKHLLQDDGYCHAVDVVAYDGSDVVWEINVYDDICDAFKKQQ